MDEPEASYRKFVEGALPQIRMWVETNGIPQIHSRRIIFDKEKRGWDPVTVSEPEFFQMVFDLTSSSDVSQTVLDTLVHAKKSHCESKILSEPIFHDDEGNRITSLSDGNYLFSTKDDLMMPLCHALNTHKSADITVEDVMSVYGEYRATWEGRKPSSTVIVPLEYLSLDDNAEKVELSDQVYIAKFEDFQKNELFLFSDFVDLETLRAISNSHYALFVPRYWRQNQEESHQLTQRAIKTLRLHTSASFRACISLSHYPLTWTVRSGAGPLTKTSSRWGSKKLELGTKDEPSLREIFSRLAGCTDRHLTIAINRYVASFDSRTMEDIVIDLAIALESCLLPTDRDELRFRLALRGAYLLCAFEPPHRVFHSLRFLYDFRSQIVHNGRQFNEIIESESNKLNENKIVEDKNTPQNVIDEFREVTRKLLFRLITDEPTDESIKKAAMRWDNEIIGLIATDNSS